MCNRAQKILQLALERSSSNRNGVSPASISNIENICNGDVKDILQNHSQNVLEREVDDKNKLHQYWTIDDVEPPSYLIDTETLTFANCTSKHAFVNKLSAYKNNTNIDSINNLKTDDQVKNPLPSVEANLNDNNPDYLESPDDPYATDNDGDSDYRPDDEDEIDEGVINESGDDEAENRESTADDMSNTIQKKTRKKLRNVDNWRRTIIKKSRNKGEAYKNWRGKITAARQLKPSCQNCRMKCSEKMSEEERNHIFANYWKLADINRQRDFISRFVDFRAKTRNRVRDKQEAEETGSRRNLTFIYHLPNSNGKVQICKTFFLNTLSISSQVVKTVANKLKENSVVAADARGTVSKNSKLPDAVKQSVRDHINSFQPVESHYCRKNTERVYLPSSLNITKMYLLYKDYCKENNIAQISSTAVYRQIFSSEFNISFFAPKKDQCDFCNKFTNSNEEEKSVMQTEFDCHMKNKTLSRESKNNDKERAKVEKNFCAAVFDLEQILPVPKCEIGIAYYKLKLSTFNFTVYDLGTKNCFCYMWHECIAKRGSSEIGSCLISFIEEKVANSINEFSLYSDNCSGQNRNRYIYALYNYLSQKYNIKIRHNFLEHGHTQNEGDSAHSVIEKASRSIPIYTPQQWYTLVRTAKRNCPYSVKEISKELIWDLKHLLDHATLNWDKDNNNDKVQWLKIKIIETNPQFPNILFFKYNFDDADFRQLNLLQRGRKKKNINVEYNLQQLYLDDIPLKKKKFDHLVYQCDKLVIPSQYHDFFRNLPHKTNENISSDEDEH